MLNRSACFFGLCLAIGFVSCDSNRVYDVYHTVPNSWHKDTLKIFNIEVPDTINAYNLFINIRNTNNYKFNNLFLITEMESPNGKVIKDTLEYQMANREGRLLGSGFTDIKENKLWYKGHDESFIFTESGEYIVRIQHAMRKNGEVLGENYLEGITDVGLRVESIEKN